MRSEDANERIRKIKRLLGINGDAGFATVTPNKAKMLLEFNIKNRTISNVTVERYVKAMLNGQWKKDSNAITVDNNGYLSNGQHRLAAIVKSGVNAQMLFAFGVDNHSEMDRGKQRTICDNITLSKKFEGKEIANHRDLHQMASTLTRILNNGKASTYEVETLIEIYGDKMLKAKEEGLFKGSNGLSNKAISAAIFVAYVNNVDIEILKRLRSILNSGVSLSVMDSPIIALRDKLMSIKGGGAAVEKDRYKYTMYCVTALEKGLKRKICNAADPKYVLVY